MAFVNPFPDCIRHESCPIDLYFRVLNLNTLANQLVFPDHFTFGTSTSAAQIESAVGHDWMGFRAMDGGIFDTTTDHELRMDEDVEIIASLAPAYRMSLMWSKLQQKPFAEFDAASCRQYHLLLQRLRSRNVEIMMVIHHFVNPVWFAAEGGWASSKAVDYWLDYVQKLVQEFGDYVSSWNTFNEPNLYVNLGSLSGHFPPNRRNPVHAWSVLRNLSKAHGAAYALIHKLQPGAKVGISHNSAVFEQDNFLGWLPAKALDWWYMEFLPSWFESSDFFGLSYYARIGFNPLPVTRFMNSGPLNLPGRMSDDMWEYFPQGLLDCLRRYHVRYRKPIVITENGICTSDDKLRVRAIHDYLRVVHQAISEGIDVRGYFHWTAWDNFEWHLGPSYRFGLYGCDRSTRNRFRRPSAEIYSEVSHSKILKTGISQ